MSRTPAFSEQFKHLLKPVQPEEAPGENPPVEDRVSAIEKKLTQVPQETGILQGLLQDPDIVRVLQAKQAGKKVRVMDEEEQQTRSTPEPAVEVPEDFDSISPAKLLELAERRAAERLAGTLDKKLEPLMQNLKVVNQRVQEEQVGRYQKQVEEAKQKFPDFNQFVPQMVELNKEYPTLNAEELYLLTKARAVGGIKARRQTTELDTESPSTFVTAPPRQRDKSNNNYVSERTMQRPSLKEVLRNSQTLARFDSPEE